MFRRSEQFHAFALLLKCLPCSLQCLSRLEQASLPAGVAVRSFRLSSGGATPDVIPRGSLGKLAARTIHPTKSKHALVAPPYIPPTTAPCPSPLPAMPLNSEPSVPEERAEQDLPPKSYADAAEEALEPESHANQNDGTLERTPKRLRSKAEQVKTNGIRIPSDEDKESLEGVGQDASPKSPTVKGHRRVGSRSSHGSLGRKHGEHIENELYEKNQDGNGDALTSVKPPQGLEKTPRTNPLKRRNSELKSGRQAGAGWARSKSVEAHCCSMAWLLTAAEYGLRP